MLTSQSIYETSREDIIVLYVRFICGLCFICEKVGKRKSGNELGMTGKEYGYIGRIVVTAQWNWYRNIQNNHKTQLRNIKTQAKLSQE